MPLVSCEQLNWQSKRQNNPQLHMMIYTKRCPQTTHPHSNELAICNHGVN